MFLLKLWSSLIGYVSLLIEGKNLEKFMNNAVNRGILLWDVSKVGENRMLVKIRINSFRALRDVCRKVGCRMKIRQKKGLPFVWNQIKRRKMMMAGAVIFFCTLYILSSVIWTVEVRGAKNVSRQKVIRLAREQGIRPGKLKWGLNFNQIQKELNDKVQGASWVGIEVKGTKVVIDIAEKVMPPAISERQPANVVAKKMGLVKEILVLKGTPAVQEGEMVRQGQVLISGRIWAKEENENTAELSPEEKEKKEAAKKNNKPTLVRARGAVRARIWYEGYGETAVVEDGKRKTGLTSNCWSIKIGGKEIILKGSKRSPYKLYSKDIKVKRVPGWRNIKIPVELINTRYYQLKSYHIERSQQEARRLAEKIALDKINKKLPQKRKVLSQKVQQIRTNDESLVRVKALVETLEDIGTIQLIKEEDAN